MKQDSPASTHNTRGISRRAFLAGLTLSTAGLISACTPLRILFKTYPGKFDHDVLVRERTLRAFVTAIVPGIAEDTPHLTRILTDSAYPFHEYAGFFAADLCGRAQDLYGYDRFDLLSIEARTAVIRDGLNADSTAARLYRGAIYMTKINVYAGIYDADGGCALIDFPGTNNGYTGEEMCYPNNGDFFPHSLTQNGIPS